MAATMLDAAGGGVTGQWLNVRSIRQMNTKLRFHATGSYNNPLTIEGSHQVDGHTDAYTLGTLTPAAPTFDIDVPLEAVRVSTPANQAPATTATVLMSSGS